MYGGMWTIPTPDVPRTDLLVVMGANPQASQGSLLACPDILGEIDGIRGAGRQGRRHRPAAHRHRRRRPTSGSRSCPAPTPRSCSRSCNVLFAEGLVDLGDVAEHVDGVDDGARASRPSSRPSASRRRAGIPADTHPAPRPRARRRAERPRVYGRIGAVQPGVRHARVVAGRRRQHPHRPLRPAGRADVRQPDRVGRELAARPGARRRRASSGAGSRACAASPRCSARCRCRAWPRRSPRPGDGPDPRARHDRRQPGAQRARRRPARRRARRARLHDQHRQLRSTRRPATPTCILPGLSALEQHHFDDLIDVARSRSAATVLRPIFDRRRPARTSGRSSPASARSAPGIRDADIDVDAIDDGYFGALAEAKGVDPAVALRASTTAARPAAPARPADPHRPVGRPLRRGPRRPHACSRSATRRTASTSGRWSPRVPEILEHRRRARSTSRPRYITGRPAPARGTRSTARSTALVLIGRRHLRSNNSWMHNVKVLVKGKDRCTLLIHPDDARARRRRRRRRSPRVSSEAGSVEVAGRGQRRDDAGRRVAAPRLGPRQGRAPACRSPASTPA